MIFRPFCYYETGCAAYLLGCGTLGKCAVVDAHEKDVEAYISFARSKDMAITHVVDTHIHAGHRSGGPALARETAAKYCLHRSTQVEFAFEKRWNPLLSLERDAFIDALAGVQAKPAQMEQILSFNQGRSRR